jgi:hypothetical protein
VWLENNGPAITAGYLSPQDIDHRDLSDLEIMRGMNNGAPNDPRLMQPSSMSLGTQKREDKESHRRFGDKGFGILINSY